MALALSVLLVGNALAGTAAYTADGKQLVRTDERALWLTSLTDLKETEIKLPEELTGDYPSLTRLRDGTFLVAGDRQAMTWKVGTAEWKPLCQAPEGETIEDVAADPESGITVFVLRPAEGDWHWLVLPAGGKELKPLFNRRAGGAGYPVFDPQGDLYFVRQGDIWKGAIEEDTAPDAFHRFTLSGSRIWPLGEHETSDANSSGVGAHEIAPLTTRLLVDRSRMGGSGWGALVRVPNADAYGKKLPLKWEELSDLSTGAKLALSPDGRQAAAYISSAKRWFLLETPDGELVPLPREKAAGKVK